MSSIDTALDTIYPDFKKPDSNETFDIQITQKVTNSHESKKDNSMIIYIFAIIFVLVIFIIIIILIIYYAPTTNSDTTIDTSDTELNIGAFLSTNEILLPDPNGPLGFLNNPNCGYGYYGQDCEFQANSSSYYNIGSISGNYDLLPVVSSSLSLNYDHDDGTQSKNSATSICNITSGCSGVVYNHSTGESNLIIHNPKVNGSAEFNFCTTTQAYMKLSLRPQFTDKVFGFSGNRPLRYYFDNAQQTPEYIINDITGSSQLIRSGIISFPLNQLIELDWIPSKIVNYSGAIGYYFTCSNQGIPIYTDSNTGEHTLPILIQKQIKLFVIYKK
jgi:hypothetical protein